MKKHLFIILGFIFLLNSCYYGDNSTSSLPGQLSETDSQISQTSEEKTEPIWEFEDFDSNKLNQNKYFFRSDGIYKFNKQKESIEYLAPLPSETAFNFVIDVDEEYVYYSNEENLNDYESTYSFRKMDLTTNEITIIKTDFFSMGGILYDNKIYFYAVEDNYNCIMQYDVLEDEFYTFESTDFIRANGYMMIHNGKLYFQSENLFEISINDIEPKNIISNEYTYYGVEFYENAAFYICYTDVDNNGYLNLKLLKQDLDSGNQTILDSFSILADDELLTENHMYYVDLLVENDYVYYSYNDKLYRIRTDGENKEKISDVAVNGDIFKNSNKIYWYYCNGQEDLFTSPPLDAYKLYSLDLISKQITEYKFEH